MGSKDIDINAVLIDNMISWAKSHLNDTSYCGWCLSFIEDALEQSNNIEIFGGDSAKESCDLYKDSLRKDTPEIGSFVFYDCLCKTEEGLFEYGHCGISLGNGEIIHAWDKVRIDNYLDIEKLVSTAGKHPKYLGWVPIERVLKQKP